MTSVGLWVHLWLSVIKTQQYVQALGISALKVLSVSTEHVSMAWLTQKPLDHHGACHDGQPDPPLGSARGAAGGRPPAARPLYDFLNPSPRSHLLPQGGLPPVTDQHTGINASLLTPTGESPIFRIPQGITGGLCPSACGSPRALLHANPHLGDPAYACSPPSPSE